MRNVKLVLQYEGTRYQGWQIQPGRTTVCGIVKENLQSIIHEPVVVYAASRTDSGVHALCQVVNFRTGSNIPAENIQAALNGMLPEDICVVRAADAPDSFHACYSARSRRYRYTIRNRPVRSPFDRCFSYHYPFPLDTESMRKAAKYIEGRHDFSAFKSARGEKLNRVRAVILADVRGGGGYVHIDVAADGFLTYMVRNIAGTLVDAGRRRITPECVKDILQSGDRKKAGPTLPAKGLCLTGVEY